MSGYKPVWVLFDTATVPDYYSDVHKVLAMPSSALVRYDYRDKYLSPQALENINNKRAQNWPVLVVYVERKGYERGQPSPPPDTPVAELSWQAIRLGTMERTWSVEGTNYFQFRLGDYPRADPALLAPLRSEFEATQSAPFHTWVAIAKSSEVLQHLHSDAPAQAWEAIVTRMCADTQFRGDTFWRVSPPIRSGWLRKGRELRSTYHRGHEATPERVHRWKVPERSSFALPLTLFDPHDPVPPERSPNRALAVTATEEGPLFKPQTPLTLRRNAPTTVVLESKCAAVADKNAGVVNLASNDTILDGTSGVELRFEVKLARWKQVFGGFLVLLGSATFATDVLTVFSFFQGHIVRQVVFGAVFAALGVCGYLISTGKLPIKT